MTGILPKSLSDAYRAAARAGELGGMPHRDVGLFGSRDGRMSKKASIFKGIARNVYPYPVDEPRKAK
jgi:hypothetical protein